MIQRFYILVRATEFHDEDVEGDGHCFFRVWARKIFGDEERWPTVRRELVSHIRKTSRWYLHFQEIYPTGLRDTVETLTGTKEFDDLDGYLEIISNDGYGDAELALPLADLYST